MPTPLIAPHRIETRRLVLRAFEPKADAGLMRAVLARSRTHLLPMMFWATGEPLELEAKREHLALIRAKFDRGEDFAYGVFDAATGLPIGGSGLHTRVRSGAFEIGYWIAPDCEGHGYVSETVRALCHVAFDWLGSDLLVIRVRPDNVRSRLIPKRLGFQLDGRLRRMLTHGSEVHDALHYSLTIDEFRVAPWSLDAAASTRVYGSRGKPFIRSKE